MNTGMPDLEDAFAITLHEDLITATLQCNKCGEKFTFSIHKGTVAPMTLLAMSELWPHAQKCYMELTT